MWRASIKRMLPRGLYGRAALILLVPVVTLQLVVSVVFIQRQFEDLTRQMSRAIVLELVFLADLVEEAPDREAALARARAVGGPLALSVAFPEAVPLGEARLFYDLSGKTVTATLAEGLPDFLGIDLATSTRLVRVGLETPHGPMEVGFDRRRVSASNPHQLLVLMVVTGVLMTLIAYLFLRNQLRPITRLAAAAEAFGKGRAMPYKPSGAAEVRAAGWAFLDMRARIERQIEQRTLMLSGVSHDLRTPLTRLKLELSMAEQTPETEAMLRDLADMEQMIDTFLDFARSEALDDLRPCDPADLLLRVAERARGIGGPVEVGDMPPGQEVLLRPLAVERALQNLVNNALRYGKRAALGLSVNPGRVIFTVEDDGPGIPADRREQALQPFQRLDAARGQEKGGGVGLGLAIASDIARGHGGELRLGQSARLGGLRAELVLAR
ncbi:ATP-binding protein [Rhodovulum steppense]|uniref:histidine kinase n=1 Tax=Rhodovulum steppense TaxID=540251 RepID=A0A4R1YLL5_9RHOB|nr:ATP-binding protein [Rhodovulum steppense]TCM78342.1 two-component system osmolarity sensor histidine kinase EnvZ [Rhodovulum steppense]